MYNLSRKRLVVFVTIGCALSLVWLTASSRITTLVSEILKPFQQIVPGGHISHDANIVHGLLHLIQNKSLMQTVPTPHQWTSQALYVEGDADKEQTICWNKPGNGWNYNCKVKCGDPSFLTPINNLRPKFKKKCDSQLSQELHEANISVPAFNFTDNCLRDALIHQCSDEKSVPNIVHYIFFGVHKLSFYHFLSIWSIHTIQTPCVILVHGDTQLSGQYWTYLVRAIPNIIHVRRTPPRHIFGIPIKLVEHKADVARLEAVRDFGGIYMDTDEILLRSLDPLRKYNFTLSHAFDYNLSNGLIMSSRNASFVNLWYQEYKTYDGVVWGHHSTIVPYKLSQQYPHLIHIENKTFVNPDFDHVNMIFKENFNWSNNYAIHLFIRKYELEHNFTDIRHLNTTIGSVARHVLYGHKELCSD